MRLTQYLFLLVAAAAAAAFLGAAPAAHAGPAATALTLSWTSPGDDSLTGTATQFDLRYSTTPITLSNFPACTRVTGVPAPAPAGTTQSFAVLGLSANTTYYFAIKSADERGNWSGLSNVVVRTATAVDVESKPYPLEFSSPWPNPAQGMAQFACSQPQPGRVRVEAFRAGRPRVGPEG
ncbi:MAG: hypothetical protein HZC42_00120 [Candidatus Eisenbacteria bacterium]|nr:hypothetical protein [Candidatus Eisenbacteria bacterium]